MFVARCAISDMLRQRRSSAKSKKGGAPVSVAILNWFVHMGCVPQDSYPRKSTLRNLEFWDETRRLILQGHLRQIKIRESKGPSKEIVQKCAPHERSRCAPKFGERSHDETLNQERCARKAAWDLVKNIYKLKNSESTTFCTPNQVKVMLALSSTRQEEREFFLSRRVNAHDEQKRIKLRRNGQSESPEPFNGCWLQLEKCKPTRRHRCSFMISICS